MREFNYTFETGLQFGLRRTEQNRRNQQALVLSTGAFPSEGALSSLPALTRTSITGISPAPSFPYPQIFVLNQLTIVCAETSIYTRADNGTLTLAISGLTGGVTWSVADFHDFLVLVNGKQVVFRDALDKTWHTDNSVYDVPIGTSICNFNGQAIVTAPDVVIPNGGI